MSKAYVPSRILTQSDLLDVLTYDPLTGYMTWKHRRRELFPCERSWKIWNTKYEGREAFRTLHNCGYNRTTIFSRGYLKHQVIWCMVHGYWVDEIDHIDHDKTNNKLINLRQVSRTINQQNKQISKETFSNAMGVYWRKPRNHWYAKISHNGREIYIGSYPTKEQAISAWKSVKESLGFHPNHGSKST